MATLDRTIDLSDIVRARDAVATVARVTPVLTSRTFSERCGSTVVLKTENLQRTGSFKIRGAAAKLATLSPEQREQGVVAASAGNHAQGVAAAARDLNIRCAVFVPDDAPLGKIGATRALGATVYVNGASFDDCLVSAREYAQKTGMLLVHAFDDPDVIAGQGSIGLELLEQVPDVACIVVPIGGGGLISGVAIALKSQRPKTRVIGVQVQAAPAMARSFETGKRTIVEAGLTIADGIAVKAPGELTLPLIEHWVDEIVVVEEDEVAEAMILLLERCKLVVEGAGAVSVAAVLNAKAALPKSGTTVALLSGGNVDASLLASISRREETRAGRRLILLTRIPDRPGALAGLLSYVAQTKANIAEVTHVREGLDLHIRETAIELVLETHGAEHAKSVVSALASAGYVTSVIR